MIATAHPFSITNILEGDSLSSSVEKLSPLNVETAVRKGNKSNYQIISLYSINVITKGNYLSYLLCFSF